MPARGLGAGIFETLMYQQQRQDQLDQEAQQMALRNAQMRLQGEQFTHEKSQDLLRNKMTADKMELDREEFDFRKQQAGEQTAQKRQGDAIDFTNQLLGKGYTGAQASPLSDALLRGDMTTFNELLKGMQMSPLLEERNKQAWARLENGMQADELRFFRMTRDTLFNSGGVSWEQANAEALGQLYGFRARQQAEGGVPNTAENPTDIAGMFRTSGAPIGANPRVQSQNEYRNVMAQNAQQKGQFDAQMNPIKIANAALSKEQKLLDIQKKKDDIARMNKIFPYELAMKQAGVRRLITQEDTARFENIQKRNFARWLAQRGIGSEGQYKVMNEAKKQAGELSSMLTDVTKELMMVEQTMDSYKGLLGSPPPSLEDKDYNEIIMKRNQAGEMMPGLNVQRQRLIKRQAEIKKMQAENSVFLNVNITPTTTSGKPVNPPAVSGKPKPGATGLMPVTPPPGARQQQPRQNDYLRDKPQMQLRKPGGGNQTTRSGKVDYSKMSDAELKRALAKKLGGG